MILTLKRNPCFLRTYWERECSYLLEGADVLVDGIDAFEIDLRRLLYREAQQRESTR